MEIERFKFGLFENDFITSGFDELDNITGGWQKGDLIMIAAPKRMGKTAFALSMLHNHIVKNSNSFIWLSTFLSTNQFSKMFYCNHTQWKIEEIIKSKLNDTLTNEVKELFRLNDFYFHDKPNLNCIKIQQILESFNPDTMPECVIIDNLNYLEFNDLDKIANEELTNKKLFELKGIARKFNIVIIVLFDCEFPEIAGKDEFCVDFIKLNFDKSLIDTLCFIYRPEYYKVVETEVGESTLGKAFFIVGINRGLTGSVLFDYNSRIFSFKQCS